VTSTDHPLRNPATALPWLPWGVLVLFHAACFALPGSEGGGQTRFSGEGRVDPADVALAAGYRIEAVARDLSFPTGVALRRGDTRPRDRSSR
jgi:hypothetical protein